MNKKKKVAALKHRRHQKKLKEKRKAQAPEQVPEKELKKKRVPQRAFFFLVTIETAKPSKKRLFLQWDAGQLLFKLQGYNRCRLFTISSGHARKIIPQIDTALTWQRLFEVFSKKADHYPFARFVFEPIADVCKS